VKAATPKRFGGVRPRRGAAGAGAAALLAIALLLAALAGSTHGAAGKSPAGKRAKGTDGPPNIVVVMTDDQELMTEDGVRVWLRRKIMPRTFDLFAQGGTVFQNFVVTTPVCCPSRATYFTGQYGHNNGVLANKPGYGGLVAPDNMLPVWLQQAGYLTAQVGRWLHGYENSVPDAAMPAPGWSRWVVPLNYDRYYGYDLSVDGERVHYGTKTHDYVTEVLNKRAVNWVRANVESEQPLFLNLSHVAPHSAKALPNQCTRSAIPARKDYDLFQKELLPIPPSFSEDDISDKPSYLQERALIDPLEAGELRRRYRCRLASLRSVDRGVNSIVKQFKKARELGNTVFIFTSDNGYFSGEHRLRSGKGLPYEEAIRVPMAIRVPPQYLKGSAVAPLPVINALTANIDIAPTLLDLANAQPCNAAGDCRTLDGKSMLRLVGGSTNWPTDRALVIEQQNEIEGLARRRDFGPCTYSGLRTPTLLYVATTSILDPSTGQCIAQSPPIVEHYDLLTDPFQLQNLYSAEAGPTEQQAALSARLIGARNCAGNAGHQVPGRTPCE
jgi:arylsulfatase A-like enzyme